MLSFKTAVQSIYGWLKKVGLQTIGGLFMEQKGQLWIASKGSLAFWGVLGHCMYVWNSTNATGLREDVSQGELYTLWMLLGYAGLKVGSKAMQDIIGMVKGKTNA